MSSPPGNNYSNGATVGIGAVAAAAANGATSAPAIAPVNDDKPKDPKILLQITEDTNFPFGSNKNPSYSVGVLAYSSDGTKENQRYTIDTDEFTKLVNIPKNNIYYIKGVNSPEKIDNRNIDTKLAEFPEILRVKPTSKDSSFFNFGTKKELSQVVPIVKGGKRKTKRKQSSSHKKSARRNLTTRS